MKLKIGDYIDINRKEITDMADYIFDNPETGGNEYKASEMLTDYLGRNGFIINKGIAGLETAFKAVHENGIGGPSIGLLCEYDALEGIGHACGHHMQGPAIVYAASAIKEMMKESNYRLVIYGTPAEETFGGKLNMLKYGCFQDIDVALMMHAGPTTTTDIRSLAMDRFLVEFKGISSHAALKAEDGRSALDGILMLANGIEYLREHVRDDVRIHYSIINGGGPPNVVPKYASAEFVLRSYNREYLDTVVERFKKIVKGAALMTETECELTIKKTLDNKVPVIGLNDLLIDNAKEFDAPCIRPPREKTGSTDFGNVMHVMPGSCIRVAFVPEGTSSHSEEYIKAGKTEKAHDATVLASKILAGSVTDMIIKPELLAEFKREFEINKGQKS
ncbi:amidohydrolase [Dethiosulfatibacter aminovorans DSM 17477]|uniref:Peptidase M20 domain-containing protein 2 n=1 Tax=Dethiosulfatibacter aminovorans DSM 17477 TaxID=1121476 RepID=A0A1M6F000_9FIRM|nr:M20 family metallopeptidase [Dethiosulfatibacter aminovorans]SHI90985.1 amidohydrolase [Dethiosulfatibacter aminovorans DSM 17477]